MKLHAQLHAQLHAHSQSISHPHVDVCLHWHVQWRLHVCCMHTYITGMHACRHTRKRAWTHPCTQHMQYCLQHMHCIAFAQYKHDTLTRMTLMTWHAWHTRPTLHMQHAWHAWYAWHAWHAWHARRTQHTRPTRATLQRPLCHFQEHHTVCFNFLFVRKQEYSRSEALDGAVVQQCLGTDSPRWKVKKEHTHYTHWPWPVNMSTNMSVEKTFAMPVVMCGQVGPLRPPSQWQQWSFSFRASSAGVF